MTDPEAREPEVTRFADLPIQPTGSGVADLEIAYEQMNLVEKPALADNASELGMWVDPLPTETGADATESAAHPS